MWSQIREHGAEEEEGSSNTRFKPGLNDKKFADYENATTPSFQIYCEALQSLKLGGFPGRQLKQIITGGSSKYFTHA
jgi:hypothetical protein